jgi:hypothetical protein
MHLEWCALHHSIAQLVVLLLPPPAAFATAHLSEDTQVRAAAVQQLAGQHDCCTDELVLLWFLERLVLSIFAYATY